MVSVHAIYTRLGHLAPPTRYRREYMPLPGPPAENESPPPSKVCNTHTGTRSASCQPPVSNANAMDASGALSTINFFSPPTYLSRCVMEQWRGRLIFWMSRRGGGGTYSGVSPAAGSGALLAPTAGTRARLFAASAANSPCSTPSAKGHCQKYQ